MSERRAQKTDAGKDLFRIESETLARNHHIYLSESVGSDSFEYIELIHYLDTRISQDDFVSLHLANVGGSVATGQRLINKIKEIPCPVISFIEEPCYSMGALLALSGTALVLKPNTFLMFHNYSGGSSGKGQEMLDQVSHQDKWVRDVNKHVCYPFLSTRELNALAKDGDIYIHADDVTLTKRIERHFK